MENIKKQKQDIIEEIKNNFGLEEFRVLLGIDNNWYLKSKEGISNYMVRTMKYLVSLIYKKIEIGLGKDLEKELLIYTKYINELIYSIENLIKSNIFCEDLELCIKTDIEISSTENKFSFRYTEAFIRYLREVSNEFTISKLTLSLD